MQDVPLAIEYNGKQLVGFAVPLLRSYEDRPACFDIIIDKVFLGTLRRQPQGWKMDTDQDPQLIDRIARSILNWYDAGVSA